MAWKIRQGQLYLPELRSHLRHMTTEPAATLFENNYYSEGAI